VNVLKSVFETMAQFMPDKKHDPLLHRDGFLGKPLVRVDAEAKVRGQARFTSEFDIANVAHAALVFSTIAKGKVSKIDTERAKCVQGVLEVLTWKNMPKMTAPRLI
jgi:xanthine dehydrogenase YagR molybdenum-binding subunit